MNLFLYMHKLIPQLIEEGYLKTPEIINAFKQIDRKDFIPEESHDQSGLNIPLPIRFGQTISQPLTVAFMLEHLQPQTGDVILDVGTGSGWQAALLAYLVGPAGKVVGIERIPQLVRFAKQNIGKYDLPQLQIFQGDGSRGYEKEAPYDKIIVAAASKEDAPHELVTQLKNPGRLLLPIGEWDQELVLIRKDNAGALHRENFPGFQFVPLVEGETHPHVV